MEKATTQGKRQLGRKEIVTLQKRNNKSARAVQFLSVKNDHFSAQRTAKDF